VSEDREELSPWHKIAVLFVAQFLDLLDDFDENGDANAVDDAAIFQV
tara:strand:+ start:1200 stop:1340 length:141 start_codon:yes stop_codon:yes gene_type:complete